MHHPHLNLPRHSIILILASSRRRTDSLKTRCSNKPIIVMILCMDEIKHNERPATAHLYAPHKRPGTLINPTRPTLHSPPKTSSTFGTIAHSACYASSFALIGAFRREGPRRWEDYAKNKQGNKGKVANENLPSGDIDVDRHDSVTASHDRVRVVVVATAIGA